MTRISGAQKHNVQQANAPAAPERVAGPLAAEQPKTTFDRNAGGAFRPQNGRDVAQPGARAFPGLQGAQGSELLAKYGGDFKAMAKDLKIKGGSDVKNFTAAMEKLSTAQAGISAAQPGQQPGKAQLKLSPDQIARIQAAPTHEAKKAEVLKAISQQTGVSVDSLDPSGGKKGGKAAREALNALMGTKIKNGSEKNNGASVTLDAIADSVAKSVGGAGGAAGPQGLATPQGIVSPENPGGGKGGNEPDGGNRPDGGNKAPIGTPGGDAIVDLSDYQSVADKIAELHSPLIFDLAGTGLKIKAGEIIEIDVDGDGKTELITDLDKGIGLLVFDSKSGEEGAGRDYFGDKTDLSAYGIVSWRSDRGWNDGFEALRALCEHYELVHADKQYLDANDLAFLEREVGLRMRIDGVYGSDRTFAEVKVTRINLGDPKSTQSLKRAELDAFGNKLMKQDGATFIVNKEEREYADIWFNVLARVTNHRDVALEKATKGVTRGL